MNEEKPTDSENEDNIASIQNEEKLPDNPLESVKTEKKTSWLDRIKQHPIYTFFLALVVVLSTVWTNLPDDPKNQLWRHACHGIGELFRTEKNYLLTIKAQENTPGFWLRVDDKIEGQEDLHFVSTEKTKKNIRLHGKELYFDNPDNMESQNAIPAGQSNFTLTGRSGLKNIQFLTHYTTSKPIFIQCDSGETLELNGFVDPATREILKVGNE